jgi:hypothetical protein
MARSGSTDFATTGTTIIQDALVLAGKMAMGASMGTDQSAYGLRALNMIIKKLANQGLLLHVITEGSLFLVDDRESYTLGTGGDHATSSYVKTEILTAASSGDLTIEVDAITDISASDVIGVELDGGDLQWTTVNGAPAANTVTLAAVLTDDVAAENHVYTYTTIIERPQRLLSDSIRLENEDGTESPVRLVSREEYIRMPNKAATGSCNQVYYDQQWGAVGTLYTWPTCDDVKQVLRFSFERLLQDMDAVGNELDLPIGAHQMLVYSLAVEFALSNQEVDYNRVGFLKGVRDELLDDYLSRDSEDGSIYIQPNILR